MNIKFINKKRIKKFKDKKRKFKFNAMAEYKRTLKTKINIILKKNCLIIF